MCIWRSLIRSIFKAEQIIFSSVPAERNIAETAEMIHRALEEGAVTYTTCKNWYERSREKEFRPQRLRTFRSSLKISRRETAASALD